ncbi:MAG TPA: hypothetical protein VNW25_00065 [Candidatus Sulfotelmatobacter sp.]|nr:hypothetical protein [Candidatus Sulfotelmatobacter sp.]
MSEQSERRRDYFETTTGKTVLRIEGDADLVEKVTRMVEDSRVLSSYQPSRKGAKP